jgi:hypothetical protein
MFNKILLAVIAAGLWANVAASLMRPAHADDLDIGDIREAVSKIRNDLWDIANGKCQNSKLC